MPKKAGRSTLAAGEGGSPSYSEGGIRRQEGDRYKKTLALAGRGEVEVLKGGERTEYTLPAGKVYFAAPGKKGRRGARREKSNGLKKPSPGKSAFISEGE